MCRLLLVCNPEGVNPHEFLPAFRRMSERSREYQGHGWGCAWLNAQGNWRQYHDIRPVWEDPGPALPLTRAILIHARSAFRDEGIVVENNMPFGDEHRVFIFNGELRGVRIKAPGRIGAEKIFNTLQRFDQGDLGDAVRRGVMVIERRTRYIRALNFFLADRNAVHLCSWFGEDPDYFQMRNSNLGGTRLICSEQLPGIDAHWQPVPNRSIEVISLDNP